jgi:hypothetical protein
MAKASKSISVPKAQREIYERLTALTDAFCVEHLNEGYAELVRRAVAALCRKRPNPLHSDRPGTWACGVLYALGQINFLFDKDSDPHMRAVELCGHFDISASTGKSKSKQVSEALKIKSFDFRWALPDVIERTGSLFWMMGYNGYLVDAREMPRDVQEIAYERGLIPYIHADKGRSQEQIAARQRILSHYDRYRAINTQHQTRLAANLQNTSVARIAQQIGLVDHPDGLADMALGDMVHALDLALYQLGEDGISAAAHDLEQWSKRLSSDERCVFAAMSGSLFSVFQVTGRHDVAGVRLRDLFSGKKVWVVDHGLEATAVNGLKLAVRLIRPDEFWMTTGATLAVDDRMWQNTIEHFKDEPGKAPHQDSLAEYLFRTKHKIAR